MKRGGCACKIEERTGLSVAERMSLRSTWSGVLRSFLRETLRDACTYTEHCRRTTVTALDVVSALKRRGRNIYGHD